MTQKTFAASAGVDISKLRYWIYKLRSEGERHVDGASSIVPRLVPVVVKPAAASMVAEAMLEIDAASGRIRIAGAPDPTYVAALIAALRGAPC